MKKIIWKGSTLNEVKKLNSRIKQRIGFELYSVQLGLEPSDWKYLPTVGRNVKEIRIHDGLAYRVIYIASFQNAIYVLNVFTKKTQKTTLKDLQLAKKRLLTIVDTH